MSDSSVSLLLGFSAILNVSLVSRLTARACTIMCLGVKRHLASGHEISRLQHGLQLIMARYTRTINVDLVVTCTYSIALIYYVINQCWLSDRVQVWLDVQSTLLDDQSAT